MPGLRPAKHLGKYINPVCCECHNNFPEVYHQCLGHCEQLIAWMAIEAHKAVNRVAQNSIESIRTRNEELDKIRGDE